MKMILMILILSGVTARAMEPADQVLQNYHAAIQVEIIENYPDFSRDQIHQKMIKLGNTHLLANKEKLHPRAVQRFQALPIFAPINLKKQTQLAWVERSSLLADGMLEPELAKRPMDQVLVFFSPESLGSELHRYSYAPAWWDALAAAKDMKKMIMRRGLDGDDISEREHVEQYAPDLVYRMNSDAERPIIAFFNGQELLVLELRYHTTGQYTLEAIKWVLLPPAELKYHRNSQQKK
ncbi:hypothetical protein [Pontiella sulfatireligans]|uniref:Uncharacterized protein n=1 Tax=Pontiella sulfatireligans TaxID=2750658 RepID=A0A6C2UCW7_9BACT|nr:hypothetical protein [Pontiella sulfatireligans]VGO18028.1 hypothetical protein SCARR_00078 [Pontiella sulfatireligans]